MKKLFTFLFATLMVCAFAFVGCRKDSPRAYADKFYGALKNKDYKTVVDMWPNSKDLSKEDKEGAVEMMKMFDGFSGGVKDYEIVSEEISNEGKSATVTVSITYGTGDVEEDVIEFVKTDNGWQPKVPGQNDEDFDDIDESYGMGDYIEDTVSTDEVE